MWWEEKVSHSYRRAHPPSWRWPRPSSGHRAIDATALSAEDAGHLGAPEGDPALRIESLTRSDLGVLFEYYVAIYRGDTFRFELEVSSP